jgi:aryl-alcohol dehydrogenase
MEIRAAVSPGRGAPPVIEQLVLDDPEPGELILKVEAVGICHTDIALAEFLDRPRVLGHETAGTVVAVGAKVRRFKRGDRVLATFDSCGHCSNCRDGSPAYCFDSVALNIEGRRASGRPALRRPDGTPVGGSFFQQSGFATHALVTERNLVAIPDTLHFTVAAPLGCGIQTGAGAVMNNFGAREGQSLAVFGCGAVGLAAIMAGKIVGCFPVVAVDLVETRLAHAGAFGATHMLRGDDPALVERIRAITGGGAAYILDAAGSQATFEAGIASLRPKGAIGVVTLPGPIGDPVRHPGGFAFLTTRLIGIIEGDSLPERFLPELISHHLAGRLPHDRIVETFDFENIAQAFEATRSGKVIKAVLVFS